jgi:hypothetical protein
LEELRYSFPNNPVEARACVADATTKRQPVVTVIKEERKQDTEVYPRRRRGRAFNIIAQNFQPGS